MTLIDLDQLIVWVDLNDEQRAVERLLAARGITCSSIYGSLPTEEAERRLEEWRNGDTCVLVAKPVMLGEGVNLQACNKAVFLGVTYKFADTFQAIHRIQRFGQSRPCHIHFVHAESERTVVASLQRKWAQHKETTARMTDIIAEHGLSHAALTEALIRSIGVERIEMAGQRWTLALNDTVAEASRLDTGSVDLIVTSIPFSNLGDLVYDPFAGIGTVPVRALRLGRRGRGVELHPGYFADGVRYLQAEEAKVDTPSLFDLLDAEAAS